MLKFIFVSLLIYISCILGSYLLHFGIVFVSQLITFISPDAMKVVNYLSINQIKFVLLYPLYTAHIIFLLSVFIYYHRSFRK